MATQTIGQPTQTVQQLDARRWLMLACVLGATLMAGLDFFIVNVAVPSIELELHASFAEIQLVAAGYILTYAVLLATGGRLGDLYGRKRVFCSVSAASRCVPRCVVLPPTHPCSSSFVWPREQQQR